MQGRTCAVESARPPARGGVILVQAVDYRAMYIQAWVYAATLLHRNTLPELVSEDTNNRRGAV